MTTLPLSVLIDPLKIEELFQKIENRKKLEQMLMDPRVIEMSKQSPQSRQALAAVVRRLQEERARKRRIRNEEQKGDMPPVTKWFNCINFMKNFSAPPRQNTRLRPSEALQRNKVTRSTPNLESTALPDVVREESRSLLQPSTETTIAETSVCIPNNTEGSPRLNLLEFCNSEKGRAMITSLINSTDIKKLFGLQSTLPTQSHQMSQCIDCLNCSDLRCAQYYIPGKTSSQRFIILKSGDSVPRLTFDGHWIGLKNVKSSATQTAYSGSCSRCSSNCASNDSLSSNDAARDENTKRNPFGLTLYKRNNIMKGSKSQSAMYTTDYSECDCDDFSSPDDICGGKYLSRILTNAVVPNIDYLTTPDVLVTYSGNGQSSDSGSSSSSCKVCKGNISTDSFQREPREIWTQKRLKTSCESCLNTFRTEYTRKTRYSAGINKSSDRSGSFGSLTSDESLQLISSGIREIGKDYYVQAKSILDKAVDDQGNFDRRRELIIKDVSVYEERIVKEENYDADMKNDNCLGHDRKDILSIDFGGGRTDSNEKQTESVYESLAQSTPQMIEAGLSDSSAEVGDANINEHRETQLDGGPAFPKDDTPSLLQPPLPYANRLLANDLLLSSTSEEDCTFEESSPARTRKKRKRVRNKCGSASDASGSSSSASVPQFKTFPRRLKTKLVPNLTPSTPQQNLLQKISKQKSRKKNCAIM